MTIQLQMVQVCVTTFHVLDLASGHLAAVKYNLSHKGAEIFNLGTGHGYSVLDLVKTFEAENKVAIHTVFKDVVLVILLLATPLLKRPKKSLAWKAKKTLKEMVRDSWRLGKRLTQTVMKTK